MHNTVMFAALVAFLPGALAHEIEPSYDRISLSASAEREVENDLLIAILFAEHQAQRQQTVSQKVNNAVRWALEKSKQESSIKVQTMQYNTSPVYSNKVITAWRARQSVRLESKDAEKLSDLIGDLQERLSIGSVSYAVSKPARDMAEEGLISEALMQFRQRAQLISGNFGRAGYRIVEVNINTGGARPMPMAYASRGVAAAQAASAPAIEAGVQTVTVTVSGTIELDAEQ